MIFSVVLFRLHDNNTGLVICKNVVRNSVMMLAFEEDFSGQKSSSLVSGS